jgi:citrate lyase beta subunit
MTAPSLQRADRDRGARYRGLRSVHETPILDDHKWSKIPSITADMFFLDLEDSVPPGRKEEARQRVVSHLEDPSFFGDRMTLSRPNHLSTPWGRDDMIAMAEAGVECFCYPKIRSVDELIEVVELLNRHGADPDVFAIIETAGSVMDLREIARVPSVVALMSGPGDLSVDAGMPLLEPDGTINRAFTTTKVLTVMAAAASRIATTDIVYAPDYRDLDEVRRRVQESRRLGFTAMSTFYPPHVPIINEIFTPTDEEIARARELVMIYEEVLAEGRPAALTESGETILVHDYDKALGLLQKAGEAV